MKPLPLKVVLAWAQFAAYLAMMGGVVWRTLLKGAAMPDPAVGRTLGMANGQGYLFVRPWEGYGVYALVIGGLAASVLLGIARYRLYPPRITSWSGVLTGLGLLAVPTLMVLTSAWLALARGG